MRVAAMLALLACGPALAAPTTDRVRAARDEVYRAGGYQVDLPGATKADRPGAESRGAAPWEGRERERRRPGSKTLPSSGARTALHVLLWMTAGAAVLFLAGLFVRQILEARGARDPEPAADAGEPAGKRPTEALVGDPDALADDGRHAEAIHVLLLHLLAAVKRARRTGLPESWTSREVLSRVELHSEPRAALRALVAAVERIHFGGGEAGSEDYRGLRESYESGRRTLEVGAP